MIPLFSRLKNFHQGLGGVHFRPDIGTGSRYRGLPAISGLWRTTSSEHQLESLCVYYRDQTRDLFTPDPDPNLSV